MAGTVQLGAKRVSCWPNSEKESKANGHSTSLSPSSGLWDLILGPLRASRSPKARVCLDTVLYIIVPVPDLSAGLPPSGALFWGSSLVLVATTEIAAKILS